MAKSKPKAKEIKPHTVSVSDPKITLQAGRFSLDHSLIQKDLCMIGTYGARTAASTILIHQDDRDSSAAYYKPHWDAPNWYIIRMKAGKRRRVYLSHCDVTFINGEAALYEYRLKKD